MENFRLNEQIAFLRKAKGTTQEELAKALGVTNQAVSKWESSQCCPDIQLLPDIADYFGVSIDELMGYKGADTSADIVLQLRTAIDTMPAGDDAKTVLKLAYTLHAAYFSKAMRSRGNSGFDADSAVEHAGSAEWGMSCIPLPDITTRMRYGSVFFSDNKNFHLEITDRISELCGHMKTLGDMQAVTIFTALYALTVKDESAYAGIKEIAGRAEISENTVSEYLDGKLFGYLSVRSGKEGYAYRIDWRYMHIVPILAMICNP